MASGEGGRGRPCLARAVCDRAELFASLLCAPGFPPDLTEARRGSRARAHVLRAVRALEAAGPEGPAVRWTEAVGAALAAVLYAADRGRARARPGGAPVSSSGVVAPGAFPNARLILSLTLSEGGADGSRLAPEAREEIAEFALRAVALVPTVEWGNEVPPWAAVNPLLLLPRHALRLELLGAEGVLRALNISRGRGLEPFLEFTPAPSSYREALDLYATPARFRAYRDRGGGSASMLDHFFDKLFHLFRPLTASGNSYLARAAIERLPTTFAICSAPRPRVFSTFLDFYQSCLSRRVEKDQEAAAALGGFPPGLYRPASR